MIRIGTQKIKYLNQFHHKKRAKNKPNGCKTYNLNKKTYLLRYNWLAAS